MSSIYEKNKLQVLCIVVTALIIAIAVIGLTYITSIETGVYAASGVAEDREIETDGRVKPADITLKVDGYTMELMVAQTTVKEALKKYNIPVGKNDIILPGPDEKVTDGMEITVQRVQYGEAIVTEEVPYTSETVGVETLPQGTSRVAVQGETGQDEVTYKVMYVDGSEASREEIARTRIKEPVNELIEKSIVATIHGKEYTKKFTVKAYSYTGGGRTASGKPAAVGRIAVDRSVIPLGTKVYVEGYGFAEAADTGGNIKGNTIDVYFNSVGECTQWGARNVTIYILK